MNRTTAALLAILTLACGEPPTPQPPTVCGDVEDIELNIRERVSVEPCFTDPEMADLTLTTAASDSAIAFPHLNEQNHVVVTGRSIGESTIIITATDPDSLEATIGFNARVLDYPLYLDDDFSGDLSNWTHTDGVLVHDGVMSIWGIDDSGDDPFASHGLEEETTYWRMRTAAMFAHDSVIAVIAVRTPPSGGLIEGYALFLGNLVIIDFETGTRHPANWVATVWDNGWSILEFEWFGEHEDIMAGSFADIEIVGISDTEVVINLNGEVLMSFSEEYTTSAGIDRVRLNVWPKDGYVSPDRCANGTCIDVRFDYVQVRGLQGEAHSARPDATRSDRRLAPPRWMIQR